MKKLLHLQPFVPHYREQFFSLLGKRLREGAVHGEPLEQEIYTYERTKAVKSASFLVGDVSCRHIGSKLIGGKLLFYNPFTLLRRDVDTIVLMLNFAHVTTWLLLLTKWLHRKRIVLWGQGISVRRYLREERWPDWKLRCMIALSDGVWIYMDKEKEQWQRLFPNKPMVALRNTLTGVTDMVAYKAAMSTADLKAKYGISQEVVLIFCARFTPNRRVDLLLDTIRSLDASRYGFVIIGAGATKPDFSSMPNVYDFGAVYDTTVKRELFALADIYFQPGWVGLSIVEAMAYGKPIFTFRRSQWTLQCVEYSYIRSGENGLIFDSLADCVKAIETLSPTDLKRMGDNAQHDVATHLTIEQMVEHALSVLNQC